MERFSGKVRHFYNQQCCLRSATADKSGCLQTTAGGDIAETGEATVDAEEEEGLSSTGKSRRREAKTAEEGGHLGPRPADRARLRGKRRLHGEMFQNQFQQLRPWLAPRCLSPVRSMSALFLCKLTNLREILISRLPPVGECFIVASGYRSITGCTCVPQDSVATLTYVTSTESHVSDVSLHFLCDSRTIFRKTADTAYFAQLYATAVIESLAVDESRVGGVKQMLSGLRWSLVDSKSDTEHQVGFPIGLCALQTPP